LEKQKEEKARNRLNKPETRPGGNSADQIGKSMKNEEPASEREGHFQPPLIPQSASRLIKHPFIVAKALVRTNS